jgi:hypothetical protein
MRAVLLEQPPDGRAQSRVGVLGHQRPEPAVVLEQADHGRVGPVGDEQRADGAQRLVELERAGQQARRAGEEACPGRRAVACALGRSQRRDVARDHHDAGDRAVVLAQGRRHHGQVQRLAVRAQATRLVAGDLAVAGALDRGALLRAVAAQHHQLVRRAPAQLVRGAADQQRRHRVPLDHAAAGVEDDHGVRGLLDDRRDAGAHRRRVRDDDLAALERRLLDRHAARQELGERAARRVGGREAEQRGGRGVELADHAVLVHHRRRGR